MRPKANNDAVLLFYKSYLAEGLSDLWEIRINNTSSKNFSFLSAV